MKAEEYYRLSGKYINLLEYDTDIFEFAEDYKDAELKEAREERDKAIKLCLEHAKNMALQSVKIRMARKVDKTKYIAFFNYLATEMGYTTETDFDAETQVDVYLEWLKEQSNQEVNK